VERDVLYLESLLDRQRIEEIRELTAALARDQRELAQLIERFQATSDPALREQILRQVSALRQRINELMRLRTEMMRAVHDEHFNAESLREQARQQDMGAALDEIEKLLREGKTDEALARLQQLQAQTEAQMRDADQQLGRPDPELVKRYRDFAESLKSTREEQARVASETKSVRDRYQEQLRERLKARGSGLKESMRRDTEAVAQDYRKVRPGELGPRSDRSLEHAQSELENLKNALRSDDFDLAAEAARSAGQAADEINRDAEQQRALNEAYRNPPDIREQSKKMAQRMEQDAQKLHDIQRKLQQLFPPAGSQLSPADRQRLQKLGQEQRGLERRAQELTQKMQQLNQLAPIFGEQSGEQLQQAGEQMGSAAERLEGRDPSRGYGDQKAALDRLEQLEQQMQQSQRGGGRGGLPLPMFSGREGEGGNDPQKVEIPEADPGGSLQDFRKDLLDAMKQGTPERYREQVKSYYEELVK
jgi:DNA repair exonuclease SbcCD ATPase subunit